MSIDYQQIYHLISDAIISYWFQLVMSFIVCTIIYLSIHYLSKINIKTTTHQHLTYQTQTQLHQFRYNQHLLAANNAVYLTNVKCDRWPALIWHLIYGYVSYFYDPVNVFCLLVAIGQIAEYNDFRSAVPLSIFATISALSHTYTMSLKLAQQDAINHRVITCFKYHQDHVTHTYTSQQMSLMQLKRGDFIELNDQTDIPADIVLLEGHVLVQEIELTGEDVIIDKTSVMASDKVSIKHQPNVSITINHFNNEGYLTIGTKVVPYNSKNMVFRATKVIDGHAFGVVIETGNDTQMYRLKHVNRKHPSGIQNKILDICITNFYLMLLIVCLTSIIIYSKQVINNINYSYQQLWSITRKMILLFNTMVPLSLQFFFTAASSLLSKRIERQNDVTINRNGLTAFQINPYFIVSDKTGTITTGQIDLVNILITSNQLHKFPDQDILPNIIACTEIQPHSKSGQLMKYDVIEEQLLQYALKERVLLTNNINSDGSGDIKIRQADGQVISYRRHYYRPYDYQLEVKIGVIEDPMTQTMTLHLQGTPESINRYTCGQLDQRLSYIETLSIPRYAYKRVIAHASKMITSTELTMLKHNPIDVIKHMTVCSLYLFHDYLVDKIDQSVEQVLDMGKDLTILTGDKMTSTIDIAKTINLISPNHQMKVIDDKTDLLTSMDDQPGHCYIINGRMLEEVSTSNYADYLFHLIGKSNRRVIYRSSPNGKQIFIAFLQKYFQQETCMIGDGSNDLAAIVQANVGIGIRKTGNLNIQRVAEVIINQWHQLPQLLLDFNEKQQIIDNVAHWVIMKHMMTAFMLLSFLTLSQFELIRDPASPWLMSLLNGFLFLCMCLYCQSTQIKYPEKTQKIITMMIKGVILGIFNATIVFTMIETETNYIIAAIIVQAIQMAFQLYWIHVEQM